MFIRDLLVSCLRRWYFLVAGLIITGFATYFVFGMVTPSYEAKASVVLIPPAVAVTVGDNPYLYLGGLEQALGVLQVRVSSPEVAAPLLDQFPDSTISVSKDATTSGPIMAIEVSSDTPEQTMELLQSTLELVPSTLVELQYDLKVPALSVISSMPLSMDIEPTVNSKKQIQMTAMAAVGGLAATLLLTGFLDRVMSRTRKVKRKFKKDPAQQPLGPRLLPQEKSMEDEGPAAKVSRRAMKVHPEEADAAERAASAGVGS